MKIQNNPFGLMMKMVNEIKKKSKHILLSTFESFPVFSQKIGKLMLLHYSVFRKFKKLFEKNIFWC